MAQALLISAALPPSSREVTLGDAIFHAGIAAARLPRQHAAAREAVAARAATEAVTELRGVIDATIALGPRWRAANGAETATLLSTGLILQALISVSFPASSCPRSTVTPAALGVILLRLAALSPPDLSS